MGLLVAAQDGSKIMVESGVLPQLDISITQGCVQISNCDAYSFLSESIGRPWVGGKEPSLAAHTGAACTLFAIQLLLFLFHAS
jgi:hypothetical protein